jgi:hypothetical protein
MPQTETFVKLKISYWKDKIKNQGYINIISILKLLGPKEIKLLLCFVIKSSQHLSLISVLISLGTGKHRFRDHTWDGM